jgi:hypothetical protein
MINNLDTASSPFDPSDLIIPAFDMNAKTEKLTVSIHPGQGEMLDHLANSHQFPFQGREDIVRWCLVYGLYCLLGPFPSAFALLESKMNIWRHERFERQKGVLGDSVTKYLAAGDKESARRLVVLAHEEYSKIHNEYWRALWLSTLNTSVEMLRQHGIECKLPANGAGAR